MERITIIGCGWLGMPLGARLAVKGYTVKGTTRRPERMELIAAAGIIPVRADFEEVIAEEDLLNLGHSDMAVVSVPWSRSIPPEENLDTYQRIADTLSIEGIERVVLVSSTSVYPDNLPVCLEEDADPEHLLVHAEQYFFETIPSVVVIRFAGLIGPGRHPGRFLAGRKNVPSPHAVVNLIHLDDCTGIIETVLERSVEGIYNACAPGHPVRREYYTEACRQLGLDPPQFEENDLSEGREISCIKLIEELGYVFRYEDLYDAMRHCAPAE
jgi:nucleoside-diphosphate-sugar epimerase